ncbi:hypothetical protein C1637_19580 [Chryseobacterium lactis]|uniref:TFIIB-type zinc ribbon-containing protein n=1 Tax=Chryseobacterium lactis TaxID=1241981 RepID=A0A3G6RI49_CHRLC|nr:hypothetical protein [Chryseobacterium lactis]AZA83149.1 hypothetical protein EG342_15245 [Chryseobacterium lactis]AZB03533.1 hypothetical protein EG341_06115 [Chryseobacterium lactis]PNW11961.1 hypothetical protein C1637_19580 [Chryseobacterium lactis]
MKILVCEMCNSTNLVKEQDVITCQSCGATFSTDKVEKTVSDETLEVTGTVKIDVSSELTNLYEIARRAKESNNNENALRYYDMILIKDPNSWEANFYVVYCKAMLCKIGEIEIGAVSVNNCIDSTLNLVKSNIADNDKQRIVIRELNMRLSSISEMLYNAAKNNYNSIDAQIRNKYTQQYINNASSCANIVYKFGDRLSVVFDDVYGDFSSAAWKVGVKMHCEYMSLLQNKKLNNDLINQYVEKIKKHDASYQAPVFNISQGACYIATAVYGSYDCSEVWILRRFRDQIKHGMENFLFRFIIKLAQL